jgi:hypothetical protein
VTEAGNCGRQQTLHRWFSAPKRTSALDEKVTALPKTEASSLVSIGVKKGWIDGAAKDCSELLGNN